jgi:type I restriction enzyme M protein
MANSESNTASQNEIVLGENEMVCSLTNKVVKATDKEMTLQSMIAMMTEEYGFAPEDMERDFKVKYEDSNEDRSKTQKVDLAIFNAGHAHDADELIVFI